LQAVSRKASTAGMMAVTWFCCGVVRLGALMKVVTSDKVI